VLEKGISGAATSVGGVSLRLRSIVASPSALPLAAVFVLLAAMYCVQLGAGSLWDNSEPQYGEIVKEMLRSGDWLTLHKDLMPWFIHPPAWFWAAAVSAKLFGLSEFSLRFPSPVFGLICAIATYRAARRFGDAASSLTAAIALGVSLEFAVMARLAIQDTMLIACMTIGSFWLYFAVRNGSRRDFWIAVGAAVVGTLVKGPVAVVLPFACVLLWALWARRFADVWRLPWLRGIYVYLICAGLWFAVEASINGPQFLAMYFGSSNVARYLSPFENQPGPWYYYFIVVLVGFFPFIAFVPQAVIRAWRARTDDDKFLLCSAVFPFVFFSAAATKLPNYIAVIFPALAILVGLSFGDAIRDRSMRAMRTSSAMLVLCVLVVATALFIYGRLHFVSALAELSAPLIALGVAAVVISVTTFAVASALDRPQVVPAGLAVLMAAIIGTIVFAILPQVESLAKPMKAMAGIVMQHLRPRDRICYDDVRQAASLDYYTDGPPVNGVGYAEDDVRPNWYFTRIKPALCVVSPNAYRTLTRAGLHVQVVDETPTLWLVHYAGRRYL
jgi:4-amino-4-deoxy-L-arabinose transferase-like glycosyltransferase